MALQLVTACVLGLQEILPSLSIVSLTPTPIIAPKGLKIPIGKDIVKLRSHDYL